MEKYLNNLIEQFKAATGVKNIDIHSKQFLSEFSEWIKSRQLMGEKYTIFLDYTGFRFADSNCAEIGKGYFDSVVTPFKTTIITSSKLTPLVSSNRIISGNMRVYQGQPLLISKCKQTNKMDVIPNDIIHTFMTQNSYNPGLIRGWDDLHNSGKNDIILGLYGCIYDRDIEKRIKQLEQVREKLVYREYIENYSTDGDNYFYVIGSNSKIKKLYKERLR